MEAGEAAAVVGAILWLAQTILETLQPGKPLADWLRQVGLTGAIEELKSEVERMETVANGVNGRAVGNKPLARSLARVKQLMYDADDVVDELDYRRLQQQVQGVMTAPDIDLDGMVADGAEQVDASANTVVMLAPATESEGMVGDGNRDREEQVDASANYTGALNSRGRKNRSEVRDYFDIIPSVNREPAKAKCKHCGGELTWGHGTSALRKHLKSCNKKRSAIEETPNCPSAGATISTNDSEGRKRTRTENSVATTTQLWDKVEFLKRIEEIILQLRSIRGDVIEYLKDSIARPDQYQINNSDARIRTLSSLTGKVYGRVQEEYEIIEAIKAAKSDNITVLPIVGIIGVGKTTLAKLVYHNQHVERKFERIWVWVSNIFDEVRVTREILDVVTLASHEGSRKRESYEGVSNYSKLLQVLKRCMACLSKKFLLVLDDVCDCMVNSLWKDLLDALGSSCAKGNVIVVTTRNLSIAQRLGTVKPVKLGALEDVDFWLLFKSCVFGDNNYGEHLEIGSKIVKKLKGNPLAAESAAEMLRQQPTIHHWKNIMKNGVWESLQFRGGIMTALKISYYQFPYNLQQCLLFCSIFPNGYSFHIDDLVYMWISVGFVKSVEVGQEYLTALVNSGFFEHAQFLHSEVIYSIHDSRKHYAMCGIMHEFARLVSRAEFATIDGLECKEVLPTVRHLSILIDSVYLEDECEIIIPNGKFEEKMKTIISSVRRLRTLIIIGKYASLFFRSFHTFIMCSLVNCTHLRYLKIENKWSNETLNISLRNCYNLEVLNVQTVIVDGTSNLINMRNIVLSKGVRGACSPAWSSCLQTIHLEDSKGWEILSLESLSSLTKLKLRNMPEVVELVVPSLEELVLIYMPKLQRCRRFSSSVRDLNSSLRVLQIIMCKVLKAFPLFERHFEIEQKSWLPNITELIIHQCPDLVVSNPLPPSSSSFCKLSIRDVSTLPTMEGSLNGEVTLSFFGDSIEFLDIKMLSFHNLRTVTQLEIMGCRNLSYISLEGFRQLVCLKRLDIESCREIFTSDVPSVHNHEDMAATNLDALPSLKCLRIVECEITGSWLSVMLQHVQALEELFLAWNGLPNLTSAPHTLSQGNPYLDGASTRPCPSKLFFIPSNLIPSLKKMEIIDCQLDLTFQGNKQDGIFGFTSLEKLRIDACDELISSSLAHEGEIDDQADGRWLLPCSLGTLDIREASLGTLQPCFPRDMTRLTVLKMWRISGLKSLRLHSCTALEKLVIGYCESRDAVEGFQSLRSLKYLKICSCPVLPQCLETLSTQTQGYELCPRLERLWIDDPSFLTMPFCRHLTSLQCLQLEMNYGSINSAGLTCEQEAALQLLTSLQELRFVLCSKLSNLPEGLHSLLSLKRLVIIYCLSISRLPERGLPPSLEELEVRDCSKELTEQCRMLATSKLNVIINGEYVN